MKTFMDIFYENYPNFDNLCVENKLKSIDEVINDIENALLKFVNIECLQKDNLLYVLEQFYNFKIMLKGKEND